MRKRGNLTGAEWGKQTFGGKSQGGSWRGEGGVNPS